MKEDKRKAAEKEAVRQHPNPQRQKWYAETYQYYLETSNPKYFSGKFTKDQVELICAHVKDLEHRIHKPLERLLDYGSGKGYQYLAAREHEAWGGLLPHCYDPGIIQLGKRPIGTFDGVICTDVMEHIAEQDIMDTLRDIYAYARPEPIPTFVYFHICCRPAHKCFADGQNVHLTVRPPDWWKKVINSVAPRHVTTATTYEVKDGSSS